MDTNPTLHIVTRPSGGYACEIPTKRDLLASIGADASPLAQAAKKVLREALDRVEVHPCDEGDDTIAAKQLPPEMQALLQALVDVGDQHQQPTDD